MKNRNSPRFLTYLIKGLKHLLTVGESLDWIAPCDKACALDGLVAKAEILLRDGAQSFLLNYEQPKTDQDTDELLSYHVYCEGALAITEMILHERVADLLRTYRVRGKGESYSTVDVYRSVVVCDCLIFEDKDWCQHAEGVHYLEVRWTNVRPRSNWANWPGLARP